LYESQARDEAKARFNAGLATTTDVAQAEASLQQGYANQRQAEANLINHRPARPGPSGATFGANDRW
jgi:outer membrane protein TolC